MPYVFENGDAIELLAAPPIGFSVSPDGNRQDLNIDPGEMPPNELGQVYGNNLALNGGNGANTGSGGTLSLFGGGTDGTGNGGNVEIGAGLNAQVLIIGLPTVDPHQNHALWNNAGVLTVSAG